jgi:hypothetical protein
MKVLNLDSMVKVTKSVTLKGVEHEVKEMSVDDFVFANAEAKKLESIKAGDQTVGDQTVAMCESMVALLDRVIPTIGAQQLRGLSFNQLDALTAFVNGILEEETQNAPLPEGANEKK